MADLSKSATIESKSDFLTALNHLVHQERGATFSQFAKLYAVGASHGWIQSFGAYGKAASEVDWSEFDPDEKSSRSTRRNNSFFEGLILEGYSMHDLWLSLAASQARRKANETKNGR